MSRVADAAAVAREAGAAVLLDALHIRRGGSTLDDVRALEPSLVPCIQLCDGPLGTPEKLELPAALPLGMTADGSVLQVEARALRQVPGEGELSRISFGQSLGIGVSGRLRSGCRRRRRRIRRHPATRGAAAGRSPQVDGDHRR